MRRYLYFFVISVSVVYGPVAFLSFIFEPSTGDLTRIGGYAERDFGWNSPKPILNLDSNGKFIADPDVLVLGDSFSLGNVWQTVLAAKINRKILSFHFAQVGCISNWIDYALKQSKAETIVVEVIERTFLRNFEHLSPCQFRDPLPFERPTTTTVSTRRKWPLDLHIKQTFLIAWNTFESKLNPEMPLRGRVNSMGESVVNAPLKAHCALFSNRRADRLLYLGQDEDKLHWRPEEVDRAIVTIKQIQKRFERQGKAFILVVVPDKLSVYQDCLKNDSRLEARKRINITKLLIASGVNTPDLLSAFHDSSNSVVDLYYPNDTHLSESGYIFMAEQLEQFL